MHDFDRFLSLLNSYCSPFRTVSEMEGVVFWDHYQLLLRWNRKLNLTRIVALEEAVRRHYAEGVFLSVQLTPDCRSVVDVGSGAGFPGYPLAVLRPDVTVSLLESDQRKAAFLREACGDRPNVRVLCLRSDDAVGVWDAVVSRAVKWPEIAAFARRSAERVAILASSEDAAAFEGSDGLQNMNVAFLPWDSASCVFMADVPRGTSV